MEVELLLVGVQQGFLNKLHQGLFSAIRVLQIHQGNPYVHLFVYFVCDVGRDMLELQGESLRELLPSSLKLIVFKALSPMALALSISVKDS